MLAAVMLSGAIASCSSGKSLGGCEHESHGHTEHISMALLPGSGDAPMKSVRTGTLLRVSPSTSLRMGGHDVLKSQLDPPKIVPPVVGGTIPQRPILLKCSDWQFLAQHTGTIELQSSVSHVRRFGYNDAGVIVKVVE